MLSKAKKLRKNTFKGAQNNKRVSDVDAKDFLNPSGIQSFFSSGRVKKSLGLFLILLSVFMAMAFISYLFSWKFDDALLDGRSFNWGLLTDSSISVNNFMGRLGAITAHAFIKQWFGISSFYFVLLFFLLGTRFMFSLNLIPLGKTLSRGLFLLLWISVFFGFIIGSGEWLLLGGTLGFQLSVWLNGLLGVAGTLILLLFSMGSFLIWIFDPNFKALGNIIRGLFFKKDNKDETDISGEEVVDATFIQDQEESPTEDEESDSFSDQEYQQEETEAEEGNELELDTPVLPADAHTPKTEADPEWEIEVGKEKITGSDYQTIENPYPQGKDGLPDLSELGEYDPTLDLPHFKLPGLDLLDDKGSGTIQINKEELEANKNRIIETLNNYAISIDKIKATVGPTVTLYEIVPAPGVRISKIKNLENDIALSLSALGIRIIAPIPGRGTIGIEVPNQNPEIVSMKSVLGSSLFRNSTFELPIGLGKTIANETFIADLTKMPHLLMAGATGQGKSVGLNAILASILYKKHPAYVKFVLVDPKKVELNLFSKIERHYLAKLPDAEEAIVTETKQIIRTINSLCVEMDNRYDLLKDAHARNIKEYNVKFVSRRLNPNMGHRFLPYIILFIDEFADLIMTAGKEVELPIARLAQLARAVGIHLVIATQRPSVNIITGTIKANFPARIAFRVTAKVDSRTILDTGGADQLIGRGDMLLSTGSDLLRLQCAFIDTPEIERITEYIGSQRAFPDAFHLPEYLEDEMVTGEAMDPSDRDELFEEAARVIVATQQGSTSLLQRKLKLGYNRAGRIIDQLEAAGIVGPFEGSKAREVKIKDESSLEQILRMDQ